MPDRAIWALLRRDHEDLVAILDKLRAAGEKAAPEVLVVLLREHTAHARAEETVLYSHLLHDERARSGVLDALDEHKRIATAIAELERTKASDERWVIRLAVLDDALRHHFQVVESELLTLARLILNSLQAEELGERFLAERARVKADLSGLAGSS